MPEGRDSEIMVRIEPTFRALIKRIERENSTTASTYVRSCILHDLMRRGLLTQELLARVATMSTRELSSYIAAASTAGPAA